MTRSAYTLTLISLLALPLGTTGCSKDGQSPTEPTIAPVVSQQASSSIASASDESRNQRRRGRGGNDDRGSNDDRGGNDNRGGRGGNDDNNNNNNLQGQEFEARVTAVDVGGGVITLANGTRVRVNAQTQWVARGDLRSLTELAGSFRSGDNPRVEGRGTRQADGTILANSIKAEVDN
ncbi:MAG TPA: hypothetical protein VMW27_09265 [Thermoanaerobaculia bacterium]|nr:hypothetical protein [Thermoanaerobaculia bacterium]